MLLALAAIAAGILIFVKTSHLEQKYGLVKWRGHATLDEIERAVAIYMAE